MVVISACRTCTDELHLSSCVSAMAFEKVSPNLLFSSVVRGELVILVDQRGASASAALLDDRLNGIHICRAAWVFRQGSMFGHINSLMCLVHRGCNVPLCGLGRHRVHSVQRSLSKLWQVEPCSLNLPRHHDEFPPLNSHPSSNICLYSLHHASTFRDCCAPGRPGSPQSVSHTQCRSARQKHTIWPVPMDIGRLQAIPRPQ